MMGIEIEKGDLTIHIDIFTFAHLDFSRGESYRVSPMRSQRAGISDDGTEPAILPGKGDDFISGDRIGTPGDVVR
jgi:hypothetical protein